MIRWLWQAVQLLCVVALLFTIQPVTIALGGPTVWDGIMYVTQNQIILAWDPCPGATRYEVRGLWIDQDPPLILELGQTSDTQMVIQKPRVGHWVFEVRACNEGGCSEWSRTDDPTKTLEGKALRVYFRLEPASGLGIE